ncbi:FMN-binding domain-containing protein [Kordiimonas lacus]|uniref:FMN-binding domain-containing protein n=2 Tax=Kordiimonas lacus TaxID=637679 RepID=A0A1G7CK73_9PROT|nr:FMN-binding domain-containing protein [Kordiimonas lacus]
MVQKTKQDKLTLWLRPLVTRGRLCLFISMLAWGFMPFPLNAETVKAETYQPPAAFVANAFGGKTPRPKTLWLKPDLQDQIADIMDQPLSALRLRYWREGDRTAWILEKVGKEQPITAGFVVEADKLVETNVLVYRESRGWEVKYPAFRNQFAGAMLDDARELDTNIDGISGATLSVNAMRKMARLALFLHGHVVAKGAKS